MARPPGNDYYFCLLVWPPTDCCYYFTVALWPPVPGIESSTLACGVESSHRPLRTLATCTCITIGWHYLCIKASDWLPSFWRDLLLADVIVRRFPIGWRFNIRLLIVQRYNYLISMYCTSETSLDELFSASFLCNNKEHLFHMIILYFCLKSAKPGTVEMGLESLLLLSSLLGQVY